MTLPRRPTAEEVRNMSLAEYVCNTYCNVDTLLQKITAENVNTRKVVCNTPVMQLIAIMRRIQKSGRLREVLQKCLEVGGDLYAKDAKGMSVLDSLRNVAKTLPLPALDHLLSSYIADGESLHRMNEVNRAGNLGTPLPEELVLHVKRMFVSPEETGEAYLQAIQQHGFLGMMQQRRSAEESILKETVSQDEKILAPILGYTTGL